MGREQTRPDAGIRAKIRQNGDGKDSDRSVQRRGKRSIPLKTGLRLVGEVLRTGGYDNVSWLSSLTKSLLSMSHLFNGKRSMYFRLKVLMFQQLTGT